MRLPIAALIGFLAISGLSGDAQAQASATAGALTMEEIAGNRLLWPTQVTVTTATKVSPVEDGKMSAPVDVPAGRVFDVHQITTTSVILRSRNAIAAVSPEVTDVLARATAVQGELAKGRASAGSAQPQLPPLVPPPSSKSGAIAGVSGTFTSAIQNSLVKMENGRRPSRQQATAVNGVKYYGVYFSAEWCGPCRQFTPQLVSFYNQIKQQHPEFEILFVSRDEDEMAMAQYMKSEKMPWLALDFGADERKREVSSLRGRGIPCLVLIDSDGKVLSHSYVNGNYVGPQKVMGDISNLLNNGSI